MRTPIPFEEPGDKIWPVEEWDRYLPSPGFITDFVLATRGTEAPTNFCLWSAIFTISSMLKRESYFKWYPSPLYPNLFVFLVGPPKCGKGTVLEFGSKILSGFHTYIPNPRMKAEKQVNIVKSRATPESLSIALAPVETFYSDGYNMGTVDRGSQLTLILDELAFFLGKQRYNVGMVDRLTHYYDCLDEDDDLTISRGQKKLHNVYFTIAAGTTPEHLEESIPKVAFGGGFMSRVILVRTEGFVRMNPMPFKAEGAPEIEDLQKRLAWIAVNSYGEYQLCEEARAKYFNKWYPQFYRRLKQQSHTKELRMRHRGDIHILKLSQIIRASRYEKGKIITMEDFECAESILDKTFEDSKNSLDDIGAGDYTRWYNRVRFYLAKNRKIDRSRLLRAVSPYGCRAEDFQRIINHLAQEGRVIIKRNGSREESSSSSGREIYLWSEGNEEDR